MKEINELIKIQEKIERYLVSKEPLHKKAAIKRFAREIATSLNLISIGENLTREGLKETPKRVAQFLGDYFIESPKPFFNLTSFDSEKMDEMIIQKNIQFYSMCEHHLLPFFGTASLAYIPNKKIIGLSKLPRIVDFFSRKPQNQERMSKQIAEFLQKELKPRGVGVTITARHLCMEMRGIKARGTETTTSFLTGAFRKDVSARHEFLHLVK